MNQNLDINNNISPTFTITGNIDTGGNILGLKGTGTTVLSGAISGAGSLEKRDSGTTILTGGNVNTYTGNTTVFGGTLQIENANALGSTSAGTIVNASGTLALGGTGTTFAAESLTLNGDGVSNAGALRNVAGANTWTGTVALGTTGSNSIGVDAGSLTISGVISGATGNNLTKVGNGALTLSGTNTYNGSTTINAGTLAVSADANLGTAPGAAARWRPRRR
jgi:autotransporter-associated beta strand protein